MSKGKGIKVIISMIGLDGHTTGGEIVARVLRDAGFEVIYLGATQTPEMILKAAIQEDVDAIGISSHASNFNQIEYLVELLKDNGMSDVPVICGGNIPKHVAAHLKGNGIAEVFPPGSSSAQIIDYVAANARGAERKSA
ncbi:B12 binding domain of Methylmalonyl-CoA mutase [Paramagnetospirillum magnetotacticum MS-1]|uniref:B12 binding domain of Methylmalonyl-CoA mutase n=1 Tax=Paramagnetospirillum magnetotacticum MS-1 TaxID=272627 RepID=A0A0C2YZM1_PARME|nr:cobalamin-dependent protein [Paramagnetospirillum magnetotacticum]KIM00534.1 B12 binding domain of Methylmalonyl-CoA mutase [Paramagnetospirillum magnetotacticum MS-1]